MLLELRVQDFAIIENVRLEFQEGLNIMTGETGSGKSVILKSLALLMGEKSTAEDVRGSAEMAVIEGLFDLSGREDLKDYLLEQGITVPDDTLIVKRVVGNNGRSKVYLNGSLSPLHLLRDVVSPLVTVSGNFAPLIELTGQHDNRHLQLKSYHLELLDLFAGTMKLRQQFEQVYRDYQANQKDIQALEEAEKNREQRIDFLRFQKEEIDQLNLQPGEDAQLESKVARARHTQKLSEFCQMLQDAFVDDEDSLVQKLRKVESRFNDVKSMDPGLSAKAEQLHALRAQIEEFAYDMESYAKDLSLDPSELQESEEKLSSLRKLQKKFGATLDEILLAHQEITEELEGLEGMSEKKDEFLQKQKEFEISLKKLGEDLHKKRQTQATQLAKQVNTELAELNMKGERFEIAVNKIEEWTSTGITDSEFLLNTKSLAKVASGGEMSRLLLSLKTVVGSQELPRTYLFDEVDTGVSGPTAEKVGRKLKKIADGQQVICVTHLPQVAVFGDHHILIEKQKSQLKAHTLSKEETTKEIARLISGEKITASSLEHAKQLQKSVPGRVSGRNA